MVRAPLKVGDIVWYLYDTGARGAACLYGIVTKAGEKTATVRWESGIRNRVRQNNNQIKLVSEDARDDAWKALQRGGC